MNKEKDNKLKQEIEKLKKENNWFNIKFSNDQNGWAYGNYVDDINNK